MFNKKVKELESRISKLEEYIETQKDIEWSKENPRGKITIICDYWVYLYERGKKGIIIGDIRRIHTPSVTYFKRLNGGNIKVTIKHSSSIATTESSYIIDVYKELYVGEHIDVEYHRSIR